MSEREKLFRQSLEGISGYIPGKPIEDVVREFGVTDVIKLASNENPLGPSPKAVAAVRDAVDTINFYPDGNCYELTNKLAAKLDVSPESIVFANGEDNMISLISKVFLNEGEEMIMIDPSFGTFESSARIMGAKIVKIPIKPDFKADLPAINEAVTPKTKLIYLCNPNNPTGTICTRAEVEEFLNKLPAHVVVVFDEAYKEFVTDPDYPDGLDYVRAGYNVLVGRTFSKIYGLAGIRVGYAIGHPEFIAGIKRIREAFCTNRLAQIAATAALDDDEFVDQVQQMTTTGREYLYNEFERMGLPYVKSEANFMLVDTKADGREVFVELQKRGIIIRPGGGWGLPSWLRISVGTSEQNQKLVLALEEILG